MTGEDESVSEKNAIIHTKKEEKKFLFYDQFQKSKKGQSFD